MKRLVPAVILALALIPGLALASNYKTEEFRTEGITAGTCVYYMGDTWIFYASDEYYVDYNLYHLEDDGSIRDRGGNTIEELSYNQPACCVFQDKLYVFWCDYYGEKVCYKVHDGSGWSGEKQLGSVVYDPGGMAAAVMGDELYLFYQGNPYIKYQYTSDGENWSGSEDVAQGGQKYISGSNIAAATFFSKNDDGNPEERILLAWPIDKKTSVETVECRLVQDEVSFAGHTLLNQYAEGVALAEGSVDGGGTGKNTVQLFTMGKMDPWKRQVPYLRAEYTNDEDGGGFSDWETVAYVYVSGSPFSPPQPLPPRYIPSAASNYRVFGDNAHNLRQEIWMIYPENVIRWDSDQCVMVQDTSQQLYDENTYKKYWTMIGVVEGPPPYALNGRDATSDDVGGYSSISYAVQTDTSVSSSSTTDDEFFVSAGGPGEYWPGVGVSLTLGMEHHLCESHTYSTKLTHTFHPTTDTSKFWVYRYYLRPTMHRLKYEIRDWKGSSLGRYAYIFSVSDMNLHVDAINMRDSLPYDPRIWDPATYQNRHIADDISHYHIKAARNIDWAIGSEVELEISEAKGLESSQSFTETMEVNVGMEGIFDIGVKGSITTEHSVSTDSINTVTVMANSPGTPAGYSGSYIKEFSFYPYWLEPLDSVPYWIPDEFKHQRPWCITYEVTEIDYDSTSTVAGLAEDESPLSMKLYAISPNPSGSDVVIRYSLPQAARVSLKVYDASGRLVKSLADEEQNGGFHSVCWNSKDDSGNSLSSGIYFLKFEADDYRMLERVVILR